MITVGSLYASRFDTTVHGVFFATRLSEDESFFCSLNDDPDEYDVLVAGDFEVLPV